MADVGLDTMKNSDLEWERAQILIALCTLSGYFSETTLRAIADRQAPSRIERLKVFDVVDEYLSWHRTNEEQWPTSVDCDRLDAAYEALADRGVLGIHWCRDTISAGHEYATELALAKGFRGYCFFHEQDITTAIQGSGLWLDYDAAERNRELALSEERGQVHFPVSARCVQGQFHKWRSESLANVSDS